MEIALVLPLETVASIICRLGVSDIRSCKLVCRAFRNIIEHTPDIAWILELGKAGYTEPPWPRSDITLSEKFSLFRSYIERTTYWSFSGVYDVLPSQQWSIPRGNTRLSTWASDGIFAQWSESNSPDSDYLRETHEPSHRFQLDIVQAPSRNRGTGWKHWSIVEPMLELRDFALSPSRGLLVLVEAADNCYDFRTEIPSILFTKFTIHLRTLNANDPHPDAAQPELYINLPLEEFLVYFGFKFVGDLLAINASVGIRSPRFRLFVWNWKSGALLIDHDAVFGGSSAVACYAFLSEQLIAIPRMDESAFRGGGELTECPLASIDIFYMDRSANTTDPRPLELLTTLDLPVTPSPSTFHPLSHWESISMQTFCTPLTIETSGCQKANCRCGWHKAFDTMDEYRVLCITFDVWAGDPQGAVFYIPCRTLINHAHAQNAENSRTGDSVPWDKWAQEVGWLRGRTFGSAGVSGAQSAYSRGNDVWPHADNKIYVHDLSPLSIKAVKTASAGTKIPRNNLSIRWPHKENAKRNEYTMAVMQSANAPILEACIDYESLSDVLENNDRSSVVVFEDSIMLLKQTATSYWKLEEGIVLLTE